MAHPELEGIMMMSSVIGGDDKLTERSIHEAGLEGSL
jgi:hypothetical protein